MNATSRLISWRAKAEGKRLVSEYCKGVYGSYGPETIFFKDFSRTNLNFKELFST